MMIRKGYADTSAGQIHYRHSAGPGAPVICLHQTASSSAMWIRLMQRMRGECAFYAFDTPGFGASFDPSERPASMSVYAGWILQALDALGLEQFHLLGHHTGVCIGAEVAVRHPQRVLSVAWIGPVPLTRDEREEFRQHYSTPIAPTADGSYLLATWEYLRGLAAHRDLALHHREVIDTLRAYLGRYYAYCNVWDQDWLALYQKIKAPTLLACARDDVLYPYFERARRINPDAMAVELDGANFEPDLDVEGLARAYRDFLSKHGF